MFRSQIKIMHTAKYANNGSDVTLKLYDINLSDETLSEWLSVYFVIYSL